MAKILIVDDDKNMRILTAARLKNTYTVETASDGREALDKLHEGGIDLIVADIVMPYMDGFELLKVIREEGYETPYLLLTAKEDFKDKEQGFRLGTDDYMTKPFSADELLWRINALLRRGRIAKSKKIEIGGIVIDSDTYELRDGERVISFPRKEFDLLFKLLSYPGQIFSKDQLLDSIWGHFSEIGEDTVKTHINRIRNKCAGIDAFAIVNIKGLGYRAEIREEKA